MKLYFGADHGGFAYKNLVMQYFKELGVECEDFGAFTLQADDDFPNYAKQVANAVAGDKNSLGLLFCRSGQGMNIAANKVSGVRSVLGFSPKAARSGRYEDHANILAVPSDYLDEDAVLDVVQEFVNALPSTEQRFLRRIREISEIEKAKPVFKKTKNLA
jgi:ribose 5-phosphate isomerase B